MLLSDQLHDLFVNFALRFSGAGQGRVPAQILIRDGFHGDHVKVLAHSVAGDHGAGKLRSLLDVVGGAGGNGTEHQFFRRPAAGEGRDLVFQFLLVHQIVVVVLHLQGVAQSPGGAGDDGDFLHGSGVCLLCGDQGMADLVVRDDLLFLICEDRILLLVAGNDHLDALLQIGLGGKAAAVTHRAQSGFVDNVGKLRAGGAGGHARYLQEVHIVGDLDLFRVHLQNGLPPFEVGQINRHAPIEAAGAREGRIQ